MQILDIINCPLCASRFHNPVFRFFSTRKFRLKIITNEKTREKYMKIADYRRFFLVNQNHALDAWFGVRII